MSTAGKRLVLVLGMHRSGTSTLTRALQVLGVDLGAHLLPPAPGDNEKGYFEDAEVHALNHDLLAELGHDWHTLEPVPAGELEGEVAARHVPAAQALLASRFASTDCFGLKDPRINRLLPFWQPIFRSLGLEVSCVVCCRNPLSVARSLVRRDGFDPVKVHYLWLEHTVDALVRTAGAPRVVVDYDVFLDDPQAQLARLAAGLRLPFDAGGEAFAAFRRDFLVESMRHTRFTQADLERDPAVPPGVAKLFEALSGLAADRLPADGKAIAPLLADLERTLCDLAPALAYMRRFEEASQNFQRAHADAESRAATYLGTIRERDAAIAGLVPAVHERDATIAGLVSTVKERDATLASLVSTVKERDATLADLVSAVKARDATIASLVPEVQARDARIVTLTEAAMRGQAEAAALAQKAAGLEASVAALEASTAGLRASLAGLESQADTLRATVSAREAAIAEHDARHAAMVEAATRLEVVHAEVERSLEAVRAELAQAQADLARTRAELADLLATTWQIPRPSRIARRFRAKPSDK